MKTFNYARFCTAMNINLRVLSFEASGIDLQLWEVMAYLKLLMEAPQ